MPDADMIMQLLPIFSYKGTEEKERGNESPVDPQTTPRPALKAVAAEHRRFIEFLLYLTWIYE